MTPKTPPPGVPNPRTSRRSAAPHVTDAAFWLIWLGLMVAVNAVLILRR